MSKSCQDGLSHTIVGMTGLADNDPHATLFTTQVGTDVSLKENRPAVIVSSTSW